MTAVDYHVQGKAFDKNSQGEAIYVQLTCAVYSITYSSLVVRSRISNVFIDYQNYLQMLFLSQIRQNFNIQHHRFEPIGMPVCLQQMAVEFVVQLR